MRLSTQWKPSRQRGSSILIFKRGRELSSSVVRLKCIKVAFYVGAAKCVKQEGFPLFSPLRGWVA